MIVRPHLLILLLLSLSFLIEVGTLANAAGLNCIKDAFDAKPPSKKYARYISSEEYLKIDELIRSHDDDKREYGFYLANQYIRFLTRQNLQDGRTLPRVAEIEDIIQRVTIYIFERWKNEGFANQDQLGFLVWRKTSSLRDRARSLKRDLGRLDPASPEVEKEIWDRFVNSQKPEVIDQIAAAMEKLSDKEREAVELRLFAGMGVDEIAKELDIQKGSVSNRIKSALPKLREILLANPEFDESLIRGRLVPEKGQARTGRVQRKDAGKTKKRIDS